MLEINLTWRIVLFVFMFGLGILKLKWGEALGFVNIFISPMAFFI